MRPPSAHREPRRRRARPYHCLAAHRTRSGQDLMTSLPLLQQREIEANVIAPLFRAFVAEVGEGRAREILAGVIRELAVQAGCTAAGRGNDLIHLKSAVERWTEAGALELTVLR